jgi:hypothetical protein
MPNYQNLYDHFDGRFVVDTMTTTIARTGGLAGAPVPAEIYYPNGCERSHKSWMIRVLPRSWRIRALSCRVDS